MGREVTLYEGNGKKEEIVLKEGNGRKDGGRKVREECI